MSIVTLKVNRFLVSSLRIPEEYRVPVPQDNFEEACKLLHRLEAETDEMWDLIAEVEPLTIGEKHV